ncbi:MAG: ATP-binding protein [Candidatus Acidiferrales bacterium]
MPDTHLFMRGVRGQQAVKYALEVACAGSRNILPIGSSGAGKTMVAKRIPMILPPLPLAEAIETTRIQSVAGVLEDSRGLVGTRPFRSPHHSISDAGLIGGRPVRVPVKFRSATTVLYFSTSFPNSSATCSN